MNIGDKVFVNVGPRVDEEAVIVDIQPYKTHEGRFGKKRKTNGGQKTYTAIYNDGTEFIFHTWEINKLVFKIGGK